MTAIAHSPADVSLMQRYRFDWLTLARDVFGVSLDKDQEAILLSIQNNPRTVVRSGHARGKDFIGAVAMLCFLYTYYPSKVICTAPTDRQVINIVLAEAGKIWDATNIRLKSTVGWKLGGRFIEHGIKFADDRDWFLLGFKSSDKKPEAWTGFHSPNTMVTVTEASGIEQETFNAIEGLLTGNSRLYLALNPHRTSGEAYAAFKSPLYTKFTLSCLNAPNVVAKKILIPGQVDWNWINTVIQKPGWVLPATGPSDALGNFLWEGQWFEPTDLCRVKVLGMWPKEPEGQLIPLAWVEAANQRWLDWQAAGSVLPDVPLRLGVDAAGQGSNLEVFCYRYGNIVPMFKDYAQSEHAVTAGRITSELTSDDIWALVDTIGEGAGVHSRLAENKLNSVSAKFSKAAKQHDGTADLTDLTGARTFVNMRDWCLWAVRDALHPQLGVGLMLPPIDELTQDLTAPQWSYKSNGRIKVEPKENYATTLGRSPDYGDALALSYFPVPIKKDLQIFFGRPKSAGNGKKPEKDLSHAT